jgi:hypothetical protein
MTVPKQNPAWVGHDGQVRSSYQPSQGRLVHKLLRFAKKSPRERLQTVSHRLSVGYYLADRDWYWKVHRPGPDRTAYVIGLFGTGRWYINNLMMQHIGQRAKYLRYEIRFRPGPTSMIYSEHATIKYVSRAQAPPEVTGRILEAVRSRFADLIFVYRHPLDSLLTNWVWWRTYLRDRTMISGISQVYKNPDDLCKDVEQHFSEFQAFADGDPAFFASVPGPRFLSFPEFVEETALYLQSATLSLRLEDFMIDPVREFSKIAQVMSVDLDWSRIHLTPPRAKPYRHLAVADNVPRFRKYIDGLDAETTRRIGEIGYERGSLGGA